MKLTNTIVWVAAADLVAVADDVVLPRRHPQRVGLQQRLLARPHPRKWVVRRVEALRNLAERTGVDDLKKLVAVLIQADRFGTSIAGALRIHGESLRATRQFKAEEMAAKASVKMSFPLVLFIFPATFIVLAGPTVIGLMNSGLL